MLQSDKNPLTIVNVGYRSTNFWVVSAGRSRLLGDLGWPELYGASDFPKQMLVPAESRYSP